MSRWRWRPPGPRFFSSSRATEADEGIGAVNLSYPSYFVWGANTGVGKTIVSAGLCSAALALADRPQNVLYLKPVQTGFPEDSDARFVSARLDRIYGARSDLFVSNQTMWVSEATRRKAGRMVDLTAMPEGAFDVQQSAHTQLWKSSVDKALASAALPSTLTCKTLWSWSAPVSAHVAARDEGGKVADSVLLDTVRSSLCGFNRSCVEGAGITKTGKNWAFVETAGGVSSPGPSGTLQCDLYRPLRLPGILIGDGKLGGISTTLAAYESLLLRGYDTHCILLQDCSLSNNDFLSRHLKNEVPVLVLPPVPELMSDNLDEWFKASSETFAELLNLLEDAYSKRIRRLSEMAEKASELLWWPFTQHQMVPKEDIAVIDSRCGERFSVYKVGRRDIVQNFDACASWWTQGPDAAMQHELSRRVAYATGRYGHVMFPENVHEPALRCGELLLQGVGQGWASRVYFSDNGSTAIEIAIKMAFRKYASTRGFLHSRPDNLQFKVLALRGSYHGDTLGAMEAQAASPFTGFLQQPWYTGRGLFLEAPTVYLRHSRWHLQMPYNLTHAGSVFTWETREAVFASARENTDLAKTYTSSIAESISGFEASEPGTQVAALVIEPIIHGAGGMKLVDPLFQRILVRECKLRGIPVVFDEVFTGLWRLGAESAAEILDCKPDIACYAKLLTGGTVPLAATLASEEIFQAFQGPSKLDALLHGHSYTAHAIGCTAAVTALQWFKDPSKNLNLMKEQYRLQELWDRNLVADLSGHPSVEGVVSIGTLFALELKSSPSDKGYGSLSSKSLVNRLRDDGIYVRPLGDVVYFICSPMTRPSTCSSLLARLQCNLEKVNMKEDYYRQDMEQLH